MTADNIMSVKNGKALRRTVPIKSLSGITINLRNQEEMVLHVEGPTEIDLRMTTKRRKSIVDALKVLYLNQQKSSSNRSQKNLPIYGIKDK